MGKEARADLTARAATVGEARGSEAKVLQEAWGQWLGTMFRPGECSFVTLTFRPVTGASSLWNTLGAAYAGRAFNEYLTQLRDLDPSSRAFLAEELGAENDRRHGHALVSAVTDVLERVNGLWRYRYGFYKAETLDTDGGVWYTAKYAAKGPSRWWMSGER